MKTHIPGRNGRTMVQVIDLANTPIDEATCKACHRSDDRRTREDWQRSAEYQALKRDRLGL